MAERLSIAIDGTVYDVEIDDLEALSQASVKVRVNGRPFVVDLRADGAAPVPSQSAAPAPACPQPAPTAAAAPAPKPQPVTAGPTAAGHKVTAPMPGKILSVCVQPGDTVQEKDTLCTLEAMKMEMSIATPTGGTVREVRAQVGANVAFGDLLFVID